LKDIRDEIFLSLSFGIGKQITFHDGLNEASVGEWKNYHLAHGLSTIELYLKVLNESDVQEAMIRSLSYKTPKVCDLP